MIKVIICGAAGRMGQEIMSLIKELDDIQIIAGVESKENKNVGKDIFSVRVYDDILAKLTETDCVVDFTNHQATMENLRKIKDYKKPWVIGTTGFSPSEIDEVKELSRYFPIFLAPNMSLGANHLYNLVTQTAKVLSDYDIEIVETHHRAKKDAPSGTAKKIAEVLKETRPELKFVYGREGITEERSKDEVCINAVRGGDVVGEHRVLFLGSGEFVELRHFATSRRCFAQGAVAAVRFIINKEPRLYTMADLLAAKL